MPVYVQSNIIMSCILSSGGAPPEPSRQGRGGPHADCHMYPEGKADQEPPTSDDQHIPGNGSTESSVEGPLKGTVLWVQWCMVCGVW